MSLEENLEVLTAALNRNSDLLEGLTAKAKAGVAASTGGKTEKADKADAEEEKPRRTRKPVADKKEKAPTVAEMKKAAEAFLDVDGEDEYNDRRALVRAIADYFEAGKFTEIDAKDRALASKLLAMAADGENIDADSIQDAVDEIEGGDAKPATKSRRNDEV